MKVIFSIILKFPVCYLVMEGLNGIGVGNYALIIALTIALLVVYDIGGLIWGRE